MPENRQKNLDESHYRNARSLMSIIATPSTTLLLLAITTIVITAKRLIASILATLVALPSSLVTARTAKTTVLARVAALLQVRGVGAVTSLLRLRRGKNGARCGVGS
jgi:hypothetical protein